MHHTVKHHHAPSVPEFRTDATASVPAPGGGVPDTVPSVRPADAHRVHPDDVLIRDYHRIAENSYALDIDWAGRHVFFEPALGSVHHHMLIAQTLRQIGLSLAHTEFKISSAHQFLMSGMSYSADPRRSTDLSPIRAEAVCTWTGRNGIRIAITLEQHGSVFVRSESGFSWVSDRVYRRLRGSHLTARPGAMPAPVGAAPAGRRAADEVVLGASDHPHRWELIADTGNPALMDHPVDHVPGLVIMEASQQAAHAVVAGTGSRSWSPLTTDMRTSRYVEFDAPCWIDAREVPAPRAPLGRTPGSDGAPGAPGAPERIAVEVTGTQHGEVVFRSLVEGVAAPVAQAG
ncbi:ScbA/BarX family gamma-butyrolactone biosynthesis protein [Streptomyces sp. NPDC060184]|uniref:ScbA/BarX family gamma-butyrolactone biosynthesis protein n=1 Tax=Streptomyces sp. NPDC060184 TaxID=3347064 RepID=UPI00364D4252